MRSNNLVISLGGSVITKNQGFDLNSISKFANIMKKYKKPYCVVVGGGIIARNYIETYYKFNKNSFLADEIAISITKANARLISSILNIEFKESLNDVQKNSSCVLGGEIPGFTTDTVAALVAEKIGAKKLINITNIGGIYDKDPRKYKNSKLIKSISYNEFLKMGIKADKRNAGTHFPFDIIAIKISMRANLDLEIISLNDLEDVLFKHKKRGTIVKL